MIQSVITVMMYLPAAIKAGIEVYRLLRDAKSSIPEAQRAAAEEIKSASQDEKLKTIIDELRRLHFELEKFKKNNQ